MLDIFNVCFIESERTEVNSRVVTGANIFIAETQKKLISTFILKDRRHNTVQRA
jgi:hypothetical protein